MSLNDSDSINPPLPEGPQKPLSEEEKKKLAEQLTPQKPSGQGDWSDDIQYAL